MAKREVATSGSRASPDHRVEVAARKRAKMRERILEATMKVYAEASNRSPVIEDVVREAAVSRGAFYLHFQSLEEALHAVSTQQSDHMIHEILPIYDLLKEPWQRFSVGFRLFLMRANGDPTWASFITQSGAYARELLVTEYMTEDLRLGREAGHFSFVHLAAATDFMLGASTGCVSALGRGVPDAETYIDECVRMALAGLGCAPRRSEQGVKFARDYLSGWTIGEGLSRGRSA